MAATSNKINSTWLLAGAGIVGVWMYTQYEKLRNNLQMQFRDIGFNGSTIAVTFTAYNPSDIAARIQSIIGQVKYQGTTIADVSSYQIVDAPAGNIPFNITFQLAPNYGNAITTLLQIMQTGYKKTDFVFIGQIVVDGVTIPLNLPLMP